MCGVCVRVVCVCEWCVSGVCVCVCEWCVCVCVSGVCVCVCGLRSAVNVPITLLKGN